jgi:hypothetical protein
MQNKGDSWIETKRIIAGKELIFQKDIVRAALLPSCEGEEKIVFVEKCGRPSSHPPTPGTCQPDAP